LDSDAPGATKGLLQNVSKTAHRSIGQPKDVRYARPWYGHATDVWYAPDWHDWTTGASTQGKVFSS